MSVWQTDAMPNTLSGGLTYCTNIHPGESWADVMANLDAYVPAVKQSFSPHRPFPLGLRISCQAADEIGDAEVAAYQRWCSKHDCYLLTVNGFPHGSFHHQAVKEKVYQPDWRYQERADYTMRLADLCVRLAHRPAALSISTVPVAFKQGFDDTDWPLVRNNLLRVLEHLSQLEASTGVTVRLALEPEPGCVLETIDEVIAFFERMAFPSNTQGYIGLCFDACHQAVEFENPAECLARLEKAGITIAKVQVSSALRAVGNEIYNLLRFDEPTYLHQAVALETNEAQNRLIRFNDLPELADYLRAGNTPRECRVHFHVPVFADYLGDCGTTRFFLEDLLPRLNPATPLEVETYSFGVLPANLREQGTGVSIVRELNWVESVLKASSDNNKLENPHAEDASH